MESESSWGRERKVLNTSARDGTLTTHAKNNLNGTVPVVMTQELKMGEKIVVPIGDDVNLFMDENESRMVATYWKNSHY